jgi:chaperonin GroES
MTFRPLHDRVLVSRLEAKETTKGGIIIPGTAQEKPIEGKVIAVGTGLRTPEGKIVPLDVQIGDTVVFNKWSGTELTIDGTEYLVMKESDITGILDTTAAKKAA